MVLFAITSQFFQTYASLHVHAVYFNYTDSLLSYNQQMDKEVDSLLQIPAINL